MCALHIPHGEQRRICFDLMVISVGWSLISEDFCVKTDPVYPRCALTC